MSLIVVLVVVVVVVVAVVVVVLVVVVVVEGGTESFLPVAGFHSRKLLILVKMRGASRKF